MSTNQSTISCNMNSTNVSLSEILNHLEDGNSIFEQKARALFVALIRVLMAENPEMKMNIETLRSHIDPGKCVSIAFSSEMEKKSKLKNDLRNALIAMNYNPDSGDLKKQRIFRDQFSYARPYFNKHMNSLGKIVNILSDNKVTILFPHPAG